MILNRIPADRRAIHGSRFVCGRIVYVSGWLAAMRIPPASNSPASNSPALSSPDVYTPTQEA